MQFPRQPMAFCEQGQGFNLCCGNPELIIGILQLCMGRDQVGVCLFELCMRTLQMESEENTPDHKRDHGEINLGSYEGKKTRPIFRYAWPETP